MTLQFVVFCLTVWSVTRLLVVDGFPPIAGPRDWVIDRGRREDGSLSAVAYLWACMGCMGFWVAVAVWAAGDYLTDLSFPAPVAWILAGRVVTSLLGLVEDLIDELIGD